MSVLRVLALLTVLVVASDGFAQCDPTTDCNANGVLDSCDISLGTSDDCNMNGVPDECDIASGSEDDCNLNGVLDACEPVAPLDLSPTGGFASASAVAVNADRVVVGSDLDSSISPSAGAAHVFRRVGTQWIEDGAKLTASDAGAGDGFGAAVSLDSNFLAVGAPGADLGPLPDAGAVYIFRFVSGAWTQSAKLFLASPSAGDRFGTSVRVRGNRVIVGAPHSLSSEPGLAAIFSYNGIGWSEEATIEPAGLVAGDEFGRAVEIGFTHAFVGAPGRQVGADAGAGEVFVYELSGSWQFDTVLTAAAPEPDARFGGALAGNDISLAIGAPDALAGTGSVRLLEKQSGAWMPTGVLTTPATTPGLGFGASIDLSGTQLVITEDEDPGVAAVPGQVHLYDRVSGAWSYDVTFADGALGDQYGRSISTRGRFGVIASPGVPGAKLYWVRSVEDCNGNGIDDFCDILTGQSDDCNGNGIPDGCDLFSGTSADCNGNGLPDECDLASGQADDCNGNGVLDSCDLVAGLSEDCDGNGTPDECDIASGAATDCNANGVPDDCEGLVDSTPPVFSNVPGPISVGTDPGVCSAAVFWTEPTIVDDCGLGSVVRTAVPGSTFFTGTTTVTYTATDLSGNVATADFTVTVTDISGPVIVGVPSDIAVPSTGSLCSASVGWTPPTASDGCGVVSFTSTHAPNSTFPVGTTNVTYTATDVNSNVSTASFAVTVQDLIAPQILGIPADLVVSASAASCGANASWPTPGTSDNCAGTMLSTDFAPGSFFPVGTTTVTYTATDPSGNQDVESFTVTVVDDVDPTIDGLPGDIVLNLGPGSCLITANWTPPTASDNCGIAVFTNDVDPGVQLPAGVVTVTYSATDTAGNITVASFTVTVVDPYAPNLTGIPADIVLTADPGSCSAVATWTPPTAFDNCAVSSLVVDAAPGSAFPVGITTVTYVATDPSGNEATASFTVTVSDDQDPTLPDLPAGIVAGTDAGSCDAVVTWPAVLGADNCGVASIVGSAAPGDTFPLGDTTVSYTVTDPSGNELTGSFVVTVIDDDAPVIAGLLPAVDVTSGPSSCDATVTWPNPSITDNCGTPNVTSTAQPGDIFPPGSTDVVYTATDAAGNVATATIVVTVADTQLPTITGIPSDISVANDPGACFAVVSWAPPVADDNCGIASFIADATPGQPFPIGQTVVTYTATDLGGLVTIASFTVTVTDAESPIVVPSGDIAVPADAGECNATVVVPPPTITENCTVVSLTNDFNGTGDASGSYPGGTTTVTWTAIDENGNVTTASQDVTVSLLISVDCNGNGMPDHCDIEFGISTDCDENGVPDECDLASGVPDSNGNGVLDFCEVLFVRGDANDDGTLNIADGIFVLQNLFVGGALPACVDSADGNDDGFVDISDVIYTIGYIFTGGPAPAAPFPNCGIDETDDLLDCASFSGCP